MSWEAELSWAERMKMESNYETYQTSNEGSENDTVDDLETHLTFLTGRFFPWNKETFEGLNVTFCVRQMKWEEKN